MAILITGGHGADKSAEVFLPWRNTSCRLPSLPDERYGHVQTGNMLCSGGNGNWNNKVVTSCLKWSVQQGEWIKLPVTLSVTRVDSSSWARDDSLVIMGGLHFIDRASLTSETVFSDGSNTRSSFKLKYKTT